MELAEAVAILNSYVSFSHRKMEKVFTRFLTLFRIPVTLNRVKWRHREGKY